MHQLKKIKGYSVSDSDSDSVSVSVSDSDSNSDSVSDSDSNSVSVTDHETMLLNSNLLSNKDVEIEVETQPLLGWDGSGNLS